MPSQEFPESVRKHVATLLYRDAIAMDWEACTQEQKDRQYRRWVDDPEIGGKIAEYRALSRVRVWIKDTPMKEFDRALEGFHGTYSSCAEMGYAGPGEILEKAGLSGWTVRPGSFGEKPMHIIARSGSSERYVCWGKPEKFNDLINGALDYAIRLPRAAPQPLIVVSSRPDTPISAMLRAEHVAKGERCQIEVAHITRSLVARPCTEADSLF